MVELLMLAAAVTVAGNDGAAIQRAIDEAAASGGGRVSVPAGVYQSGSLRLRSGVDLHLEKGAVIRGERQPLVRKPGVSWESAGKKL